VRQLLLIILSCSVLSAFANDPPVVPFTENKGQWPGQVAFRALVPGGALFVEHDALTYTLHAGGPMGQHGHQGGGPPKPEHAHAFRVHFEGAEQAAGEGSDRLPQYENYFLGNDPAKWGTRCSVFGVVRMQHLYPGIDLLVDGRTGLKYAFIVAPGADASLVRMRFDGQDGLRIHNGRLVVKTSAGDVTDEAPVVYQETAMGRKAVRCHYVLHGDQVSFALPDGYDHALPLTIDPVLTFASYSGSTADNFGFTATYDAAGNLYGGGIVFGSGYPSTVGVLDPAFNGGTIDIGLTKFSADGSSLIWSTYIGGGENEVPHSLVVNDNDELYLLATTGSTDFPTTSGAYDQTFNGGVEITVSFPVAQSWVGLSGGYGYGHANGTDIAVAHFSADCTSLIACTYVGGSGNDGINNVLPLVHNYGDHFRGEIALDGQQHPVVATSTQSADMPISANAPQTTFGGGTQDAYLFRMDPALSTLQATFHGGSGNDSGYGVQMDSNGQIYMTGGTTSTDLPMAGSPYQASNSGDADGYVARFSTDATQLLSATYLGTSAWDQSYFVQLNTADEVFVVGQTHGAFPVTPGKYANPGSSQFIEKFDHDLSASLWSTVIGSGPGNEDISPSAFLVSDCGFIYFSGWGGIVNGFAQAGSSTTIGLPVTSDAFQSTTDGSDFYLMVLDEDAVSLSYATFFGGPQSKEHVDGGTSRFDKHGNVYQAVCAGCGSHDDFPTTPGAWSNTNNSGNCNLGVFKFNLSQPVASISIDGPDYVCLPQATASFQNLSTGGTIFNWDFGDGTDTVAFAPTHAFSTPGTCTISMVLSDDDPCTFNDTAWITIVVVDPQDASIDPVPVLCPGSSVQLHAHGGYAYEWLPAEGISDLTVADPVVQPASDITYHCVVTDSCGSDTVSMDVVVAIPSNISVGGDTAVCLGNSVPLSAQGGATYLWSPASSLDDPTSPDPLASPMDTTMYTVVITTSQGCVVTDSMLVVVQTAVPVPVVDDTVACLGDAVQLHAQGGDIYLWQAAPGIVQSLGPDPVVTPPASMYYVVQVGNACGVVLDSAFVEVREVVAEAWPDTTVCPGEAIVLHASGGIAYAWSPGASNADSLVLATAVADVYSVAVSDNIGCMDSAFVQVSLFPGPSLTALGGATLDYGESTLLHASGNGTFLWSPDSSLSCATCPDPVASPITTTVYTVQLTDTNGCTATDAVTVLFRGTLYVPNTFTPNGDGFNDRFFALGRELKDFRMMVFDRWGVLLFSTERLGDGWDGTFNGHDSPVDTYVWRIDLAENDGKARTVYGHVNLIR
jgi:gliding motility-associated-like protein